MNGSGSESCAACRGAGRRFGAARRRAAQRAAAFVIAGVALFLGFQGCGENPFAPVPDVQSTSSRVLGHVHTARVSGALIEAPPANDVEIGTTPASSSNPAVPDHNHTLTLKPTDLEVLQQDGGLVEIVTSTDESHAHIFVFTR